jgi:hypothetical protein
MSEYRLVYNYEFSYSDFLGLAAPEFMPNLNNIKIKSLTKYNKSFSNVAFVCLRSIRAPSKPKNNRIHIIINDLSKNYLICV